MFFRLGVVVSSLVWSIRAYGARQAGWNSESTLGRSAISGRHSEDHQKRSRKERLHALAALALSLHPVAPSHQASFRRHARSRHGLPRCSDESADFELELKKPFGITFMDARSGAGVRVDQVERGGSAADSTYVWRGDVLLSVGSVDLTTATPVEAEAALILAPESATFSFRRFGHYGCIDFPDGKRTFALPGESFKEIVQRAAYTDIEFRCNEGKCGTCDMYLRNADTGNIEAARLCMKSLPPASATASPWELLQKDHPEAQEAKKRMEEKLLRMQKR